MAIVPKCAVAAWFKLCPSFLSCPSVSGSKGPIDVGKPVYLADLGLWTVGMYSNIRLLHATKVNLLSFPGWSTIQFPFEDLVSVIQVFTTLRIPGYSDFCSMHDSNTDFSGNQTHNYIETLHTTTQFIA